MLIERGLSFRRVKTSAPERFEKSTTRGRAAVIGHFPRVLTAAGSYSGVVCCADSEFSTAGESTSIVTGGQIRYKSGQFQYAAMGFPIRRSWSDAASDRTSGRPTTSSKAEFEAVPLILHLAQ